MSKNIIIAGAAAVVVAAAVAGGVLIGRTTSGDGGAVATPSATDAGQHSVAFAVDPQYEGRVLLTRSDCTGDGRFTGFFRWTLAPGTEGQTYHIVTNPWEGIADSPGRNATSGVARIGGLVPRRQYTVTVHKPGSQEKDIWAVSMLTAPPCDDYAAACPPSTNLMAQGPVSGATTDTTARVWLRTCYGATATVEYKVAGAPWAAAKKTPAGEVDPAHDNTAIVTIDGLEPSTRYDYRLTVDGILPDQPDGHFWTMPRPGAAAQFRFLTASDAHQLRTQNRPGVGDAFVAMRQSDARFAILLGDLMSVDDFGIFHPSDKEAYLRHYRDNWSQAQLRTLLAGLSTVMMWDDHDILNDWDKKDAAPYGFAKEAFEDFAGRQSPPPVRPGAMYFTFDAGDVSFFVLDSRSFRDKKDGPDNERKMMLGAEQKQDLKRWLTSSTAKFKFIASGVPFNDHQTVPLKKNDGWDGFRTEREEIFDFIHDNHVGGVMLISGDAHWPGVFKLSHGIVEFQTSPAAVSPPNPPLSVNGAPDVLFKDGLKNVFGRFDVDTTATPPRVDFTMMQSDGTELYKLSLTEADLAQ